MQSWHETIHNIYFYNEDNNTTPTNVMISGQLSPLTNFIINVFEKTLGKRNLIIAIPDNLLRPIPIMSYLFAKKEKKDVLVLTQKIGKKDEQAIEHHRRNYHLLNYGDIFHGEYLFADVPMGIISDQDASADPYIPLSNNKQRYIEIQKNNFKQSKNPKIILSSAERKSRIIELLKNISIDEKQIDVEICLDIGLIIFENVDRFCDSYFNCNIFLEWLKPMLEKGVNFIFHFSNPESIYIDFIKNETKSLFIPWSPLILNKQLVKSESVAYFEKMKESLVKKKILNSLNVDMEDFYYKTTHIQTINPLLNPSNIDYHFRIAGGLKKSVNDGLLVNRILYYTILSVFYKLPNLLINPSKYKQVYYGENGPRHYNLNALLKILREKLSEENEENRLFLKYLIREIYSVYTQLMERKRFNEDISYPIIGKDYLILDLINNHDLESKNIEEKVILATYSPSERNIIKKQVDDNSIIPSIEIEHIANIHKRVFDRSKTTLILSGPLRIKYFSELLKPYKNIYFLGYEGRNHETIQEQVNLISDYSFEREKNLLNYLREIYEFLDVPEDLLISKFRKINNLGSENSPSTEADASDLILNILKNYSEFDKLKEHELNITTIENRRKSLVEQLEFENIINESCINVTLKRITDSEVTKKDLPTNKSFFYLKERFGKIEEGLPTSFKKGYYVVILDNNERKGLLEFIIDIFGLEKSIDKYLIASWKYKLIQYMEKNELTYSELFRQYKSYGGERTIPTLKNWIKEDLIGPKYQHDLFVIGKMLQDYELTHNYDLIYHEIGHVRTIHITTGKKLRRIIKELLNGSLDHSKLSIEEYQIYKKIKDGIYEIEDISDGED